jgi:cytosine permease
MSTEATAKKAVSMEGNDFADSPVPLTHRVTWTKLTFVWFGAAMVAQLYLCGVVLGSGMGNFNTTMTAIIAGALFLAVFTALNGVIGYVTGCNTALSSRYAYGSIGVAIPGFHIADIGWFVVNNAIFSSILYAVFPQIDIKVYCILFSMLFITNNYIGFNQMVILNRIAFPILIFVGFFGIYRVSTLPGGLGAVLTNTYPNTYSMTTAVTMVIGTWVAGCSRSADYFRFARRPRDTVISSLLGFFFGFSLCIICGAIWGAATGTSFIGGTLVALNIVVLGAIMFFVQTWTTAEHSSYITSTALPTTIEVVTKKKAPRRFIVLAVGVIAICITGLDIQNYYVPFISFLGYFLPVIGAIILADYFIMSRGSHHWTGHKNYYKFDVGCEDVLHHKFNIVIIPTIIVGVLIALKISWGIGAINSFIGTVIFYVIFSFIANGLGLQKKEIAKNTALTANGGNA